MESSRAQSKYVCFSLGLVSVISLSQARQVIHNMPLDSQGFINEWKGKQLDGTQTELTSLHPDLIFLFQLAMVESVRDGTTLRVRLFMPDGEHQFVNITLAGARSPRVALKQGETSELLGDEVSRYRSMNTIGALILS